MKQTFKYGFTYKGLTYGWKNENLYRLPSSINGRHLPLKEMQLIPIGNNVGYRVSTDRKTVLQLKELTKEINFEYELVGGDSNDLPRFN